MNTAVTTTAATDVMRDTLHASEAGMRTFPQVIAALTGAGVEAYFADLASGTDTFYLATGETHTEKMTLPQQPIAEDFSHSQLVTTIRATQADQIRYPDFLPRAMAAGVTAYWVFLTGRKVIYFGRKGELHIEEFPGSKS